MNPIPFTYTHFLQAIQSMKDSMLMCYIDESVGIYCRIRGKSVGPRPASAKDYSPEYADAFETANYAIFKVARKLGSYNPEKAFRPYLREALQNTIKDILKEDGKGDFFNKTAHKKNQAEEPELHQRVDADTFGPDGAGREPDNEASERAERVRKHKDDALEAMIKFVDTLPEMKRAALYASAFGKALRPDLESYGRNYADILAGLYNTTAQYIRKLATEGKKAALAEVHRQGFSEKSMTEISMGFLQVRTPVQDINDKVLQAMSDLDSYQQFMFLRHLAGTNDDSDNIFKRNSSLMSIWSDIQDRSAGTTVRKEDLLQAIRQDLWNVISDAEKMAQPRVFPGRLIRTIKNALTGTPGLAKVLPAIQDHNSLLSEDQLLLLKACLLLPFKLGRYESLDDILNDLDVKIIVEPGKPTRTLPSELQREEKEHWLAMKLRGLYCPDKKVIKLFPENMKDEYEGKCMNELLVSTLAHEAMHAYFDRPQGNDVLPYVISVEEPLAEFGMLVFLYENRLFYHWAEKDVCSKMTVYRYGYALMSQHRIDLKNSNETPTRTDLERYKRRVF